MSDKRPFDPEDWRRQIVHLEWTYDDMGYMLRTGAGHLTEAELIRVAESVHH